MSKLTFLKKHMEIMIRNPNVLRISDESITFSDDFKVYFVEEYVKGKLPRIIFEKFPLIW